MVRFNVSDLLIIIKKFHSVNQVGLSKFKQVWAICDNEHTMHTKSVKQITNRKLTPTLWRSVKTKVSTTTAEVSNLCWAVPLLKFSVLQIICARGWTFFKREDFYGHTIHSITELKGHAISVDTIPFMSVEMRENLEKIWPT